MSCAFDTEWRHFLLGKNGEILSWIEDRRREGSACAVLRRYLLGRKNVCRVWSPTGACATQAG